MRTYLELTIASRLTRDQNNIFKMLSMKQEKTRSELIRDVLLDYINKHKHILKPEK